MAIKYHVLSIDGGGVRGIMPARFLKEIEVRTGKNIHDLFDFVAGTSTGGLIAIAAACQFNADTMLDLYLKGSADIFPHSVMRNISTGEGLFGPKYDRASLDKLLDHYFGDKMLSEAMVPICITSYDLDSAAPKIWSSLDTIAKLSPDAKLKDVAGATSAAPTYFSPKEFYDAAGNIHHAIDGGMFLNNPQVLAMNEIIKHVPGATRDEILLISMGTGNIELKWDIEALKDAGIMGWIKGGKIIDVMMDGNSDFANMQASILYPNLYRLQVDLPKELGEMDNASQENLKKLLGKAEDYIRANDTTFAKIAELLTSNHHENDNVLVADAPMGAEAIV